MYININIYIYIYELFHIPSCHYKDTKRTGQQLLTWMRCGCLLCFLTPNIRQIQTSTKSKPKTKPIPEQTPNRNPSRNPNQKSKPNILFSIPMHIADCASADPRWLVYVFDLIPHPYHTIPYHTIPYPTMPFHTAPIPYHTLPCPAIQYINISSAT